MTNDLLHPWNLTPREAIQLQKQLKKRIKTDLILRKVQRVAGVDVAYIRKSKESVATAVVLSYPQLTCVESAVVKMKTLFPYVPGLLSFREVPAISEALEKLSTLPELVFVDGHGQAHPRHFGIACHLGLWFTLPSVGIGKSLLRGQFQEPALERGASSELLHQDKVIGKALRTRPGVKPIFVSVGYDLSLPECVHWTLELSPRFRIPEPIRQAHRLASHHVY